MRVIFLAYRDWALEVSNSIVRHPKVRETKICVTEEELVNISDIENYDLLITCGWSDELPQEVHGRIEAIGVHCAELDRYSYGSPLQLQIIDGLKRTKHRIFSFTYDKNSPRAHTHNRLFSHEVDLDLSGSIKDVLQQMTFTSKALFNWYLDDYPKIHWKEWPEEKLVRQKRKPEDSYLSKEAIVNMSTEELYNFFRSLESPYPNGEIVDDIGILTIHKVSFKYKK